MMHDDGFLDAILETPADPAPMLVYADYLAERGGLGDEDLAYAFDMAAMGQPLTPHLWAVLQWDWVE